MATAPRRATAKNSSMAVAPLGRKEATRSPRPTPSAWRPVASSALRATSRRYVVTPSSVISTGHSPPTGARSVNHEVTVCSVTAGAWSAGVGPATGAGAAPPQPAGAVIDLDGYDGPPAGTTAS